MTFSRQHGPVEGEGYFYSNNKEVTKIVPKEIHAHPSKAHHIQKSTPIHLKATPPV